MSRTKAIGRPIRGMKNTVGQIPLPEPWAANAPKAVPAMIAMMASFLAVLELDLAEVAAFLATTLDALPRGAEALHLDFDAELDQLVG